MYAVIRKFDRIRNMKETSARVEAGMVPMMRQAPGFQGYYVVDCGGTAGASISLFDNQANAESAHQMALGWIRENLKDVIEGEPEVTAGEVLVSAEARHELAM